MKYIVIENWKLEYLIAEVNSYLEEGWKLQGGVSVAVNGQSNNKTYVQALVKE